MLSGGHAWRGNSFRDDSALAFAARMWRACTMTYQTTRVDVVGVCNTAARMGRPVLKSDFGIHWLTARQMAGIGVGNSSVELRIVLGGSPGHAMTMDTARLDLVNSTLQSTNEASVRGLFRMRRASEP